MRKNSKTDKRLDAIEATLGSIAEKMERSHFYEYVRFVSDKKRFIVRAFFIGAAKGLGAAVGFSLLGALAIYILQLLATSHLPYIADFISNIIRIIENGK